MPQSRSRLDVCTIVRGAGDILQLALSILRPRGRLAAENLFLRKQLALYLERQVKPRRADDATRVTLVALFRLIEWRQLLTVVKPETLIRWHRKGFRLFWRWKSRPQGRPRVPADLRQLIAELLVKLGIRASPRTVRRYMPSGTGSKRGPGSQALSTFVRNHARSMLACDFFVAVTVGFRVLYIFVVLEVGTRRILHWNVTDHPTAEWTAQQFRIVVSGDEPHRFVVHDHDSIYSEGVDRTIAAMGLTVVKTPVRVPQGNAFCERLIGTIRRGCLDFEIPLHERHLRSVLAEWVGHYNRGRPHASLGPGIPDPAHDWLAPPSSGHRIRDGYCVVAKLVLGGLHHEYRLEPMAA